MHYVPYVIENVPGGGERSTDIYSRLLKDRIIFIGTEINDQVANAVIAQLLFLFQQDPKKDVSVYINSPGGSITAGLAIYDTMQFVSFDISTYCLGQAASMGALLLSAGTKGKRYALPHSRMMIHQPHGGVTGTAEDILVQAKEILTLKDVCASILAERTGQTVDKIKEDSERDLWMNSDRAIAYGLIDKVAHIEQPKHKG